MRYAWMGGAAALTLFAVCEACGSAEGADVPVGVVDGGAEPVDAPSIETAADATPIPIPHDCLPSPSDDGAVVRESCGVFVSASTGSDTNAGSRTSPLKTMAKAVALARLRGNPWVFACQGTYTESTLDVDRGLGVYGHFDCETWTRGAGQRAVIEAATGGAEVFRWSLSGSEVAKLEALEVHAKDAVDAGASSIAVFVSGGTLEVKDAVIRAGNGKDGLAGGDAGAPMPQAAGGNNSTGQAGGGPKVCACGTTTTGGGPGGTAGFGVGDGTAGLPNLGAAPPKNGAGGLGSQAVCSPDGQGHTGADALAADAGVNAAALGQLDPASSWRAAGGASGLPGTVGQGGGGGGARNDAGGGSGGCGGCGGAGGLAGGGGGGSICIAAVDAVVKCTSTQLEAGKGGQGGPGSAGQSGQQGGDPGGDPQNKGCTGGSGGNGGTGGHGGGGAGGVVVGVLYKGATPPTLDPSTTFTGGDAGTGGTGGTGAKLDGVKADKLLVN